MRLQFVIIFHLTWATGFTQTIALECDSLVLRRILRAALKWQGEDVKSKHTLVRETTPFDSTRTLTSNEAYLDCPYFDVWPIEWINAESIKSELRDHLEHGSFTFYISRPAFILAGKECVVVNAVRSGEWGGSSRYLYIKKRGRKWKVYRAKIISVS